MASTPLAVPFQQLRRHTGAAGAPATLLSGQLFASEVDGLFYLGVGDNGSGVSTSQIAIGALLDSYRYKKAINANATTGTASGGAGGVDAMIAFCRRYGASGNGNSAGSNDLQAAMTNIAAPYGGDFETLVLKPWLQGAVAQGGLGLSTSTSPTIAGMVSALRAAALALTS